MNNWLDSCTNHSKSLYEYNNDVFHDKLYYDYTDYSKYFANDDIDEKGSKYHIDLVNKILTRSNYNEYVYSLQKYNTKYIFIPPHCNRYHCLYLFKKMVDYSLSRKFIYNNKNLIYPELKEYFYEFCYVYTDKINNKKIKKLTTKIPIKIINNNDDNIETYIDDEGEEIIIEKSVLNKFPDERAEIIQNINDIWHDVIIIYINDTKAKILDQLTLTCYDKFLKFMLEYNVQYLAACQNL